MFDKNGYKISSFSDVMWDGGSEYDQSYGKDLPVPNKENMKQLLNLFDELLFEQSTTEQRLTQIEDAVAISSGSFSFEEWIRGVEDRLTNLEVRLCDIENKIIDAEDRTEVTKVVDESIRRVESVESDIERKKNQAVGEVDEVRDELKNVKQALYAFMRTQNNDRF